MRPHLPTMSTPLSVLDLAPITEGSDAAQSFRNSLALAQHAERLGYRRFWLAEHHGMPLVWTPIVRRRFKARAGPCR